MERRNPFSAPGFEHRAVQTVARRYTTALSRPLTLNLRKKEKVQREQVLSASYAEKMCNQLDDESLVPISKQPQDFYSLCCLYNRHRVCLRTIGLVFFKKGIT